MAYCAYTDVRRFLPREVVIEGENPIPDPMNPNPETLTQSEIAQYIAMGDQIINEKLAAMYVVPLRKINMGGTLVYPPPVTEISARYAAKLIFEQRLSGADRQHGDFVMDHFKQAEQQLNLLQTGHARLIGHSGQRGSRFGRSAWYPTQPGTGKEAPPQPQ